MFIPGGYFVIARKLWDSKISKMPPHYREIWQWLLKEANHKDIKHGGTIIKRGQCIKSYNDIIQGLSWYVGYRKQTYKKHHCEKATAYLVKENMIETTKTTRGLVITICNYDIYQNQKNYDSDNGATAIDTMERQWSDTINKECNECNKKEKTQMPFYEIIVHLNQKSGKDYKTATKSTQKHIHARWEEGFRLEDFKKVIDIKVSQWKGTENEKYIRPETLFGTKFEGYLNEKSNISKKQEIENQEAFDAEIERRRKYIEEHQQCSDK